MSLLYNSIYRHQKYNTVSNVLTVLVEYLKLYTGIAAVPVRVISPPLSKNCPDHLWPTAEEAVYTQWIRPLELIFTSGRTRPACWPDGQLAGVSRMALGRGGISSPGWQWARWWILRAVCGCWQCMSGCRTPPCRTAPPRCCSGPPPRRCHSLQTEKQQTINQCCQQFFNFFLTQKMHEYKYYIILHMLRTPF